jgi:hypothetical protein
MSALFNLTRMPNRRHLLQTAACGFGGLAMRGLLDEQSAAAEPASETPDVTQPHFHAPCLASHLSVHSGWSLTTRPFRPQATDCMRSTGRRSRPGVNEHID